MATEFNTAPALGVPFTTADATPVVAAELDMAHRPLESIFFEVKVIGVYADGSKMGTYWRQAAFRAAADGTVTQVGSTRSVVTDNEDTAGMDVTVAASGTKIQVTVTGVAATTINWMLSNDSLHGPYGLGGASY